MSLARTILLKRHPILRSAITSLIPQSTVSIQNDTLLCTQTLHFTCVSKLWNRQVSTSPNFLASSVGSKRLLASSETLVITEACKKRLSEILDENGTFLRVSVEGGGCSGFQYRFEITKKCDGDDILLHMADNDKRVLVAIDATSLDILRGSTLDFETELIRSAFRIINNPRAEQGCSCGASFNVKIE